MNRFVIQVHVGRFLGGSEKVIVFGLLLRLFCGVGDSTILDCSFSISECVPDDEEGPLLRSSSIPSDPHDVAKSSAV